MAGPHLLELLPEELPLALAGHGIELTLGEARRLSAALFLPPGAPASKQPLAKRKLAAIFDAARSQRLEVVERATDPSDGFVKYLLRSPDGALSEAVRIPLEKPGRFSVCLSSQVGCAMQCVFCATGRLGFTRHLEAWEMVSAFLTVRDEAPGRISGAVFQGQGEPLHNYERVIQAARMLTHPCCGRISGKAITISTVGMVREIRRYAREGHPYRLIISLTSANAARRSRLLPVAGRVPLEELAEAVREYAKGVSGRVTLAWVLIGGENSGEDEVRELERLFAGIRLRINLIDVNDARPDGFVRASDVERKSFMNLLQILKAPIVRRYSGGSSRHAACGMLAAHCENSPERAPFTPC